MNQHSLVRGIRCRIGGDHACSIPDGALAAAKSASKSRWPSHARANISAPVPRQKKSWTKCCRPMPAGSKTGNLPMVAGRISVERTCDNCG